MSDVEREVLKMYDRSKPVDEDLFETSNVNQLAWTLVALLAGLVMWLCIALVNAENQRHALMTNKCADPLFKGELDQQCLVMVRSRDHWWQHLGYALTHVTPAAAPK
ncbi:hypothetical protein [Massilia psychrophila]|uniref:Uncharacterized protein n=1 Tax=Massilia psychrophila TaxID=1603353 RepID=A0A2G8T570_9BURK|nr:hypothetical protein [Massilia psychrophila]PIL41164.1 hypothetical protein CR103_03425 [Massilia psychrophila]GGE67036.1 hypothetical protein GCM10008020_09280 [Massilia psychrophila]